MAADPLPGKTRWVGLGLRVVLVLAVALSDAVLLAPPPGARASRSEQAGAYQVTLRVGSGSVYSLPKGASVILPISISVTGAIGLASASVLVQYDPLQLQPIACDPQTGSPGGFCNIAYDPEHGLIRFNVISSETGLLGDAGLFDLTLAAASTSTVRTVVPVTPLIESITDLQGNYMTSWAQGSTVKIAAVSSGSAAVYVGEPRGPSPLSITRGLTTSVPIVITGVTGLGSASFSLAFDPAVVRPLECRPVQRPDADGMCELHAEYVAANLISQDGVPKSVTESVTAFEVVFTTAPTAAAGAQSPLTLTLEAFNDTAGAPISVQLNNNALKVSKTAGAVEPILRLDPVSQNLNDDALVTVHVFLDNGAELAAGSWGIRYDPLVVQAESCQIDSNVVNAVCNPAAEPGLVRMTVLGLTEGGLPADLPADIGSITFRRHPQAKAKEKSSLTFEVTNFANALGEQLPYRTQAAGIIIAGELGLPAAVTIRLTGTPPYQLYRGASLALPVNFTVADPDRAIANLTGSVYYDPIVLRPTQCVLSNPAADAPTAFCNAQHDTKQGIIRFTLFDAEGFSGSVTPFLVRFEAASTAVAGNISPLHFTVEAIGGPQGEPRTWAATDETVKIKTPVFAPRVLVGPPDLLNTEIYTVTLGKTATVPLWVENVSNLGAGTIEVRYDPTVARATQCTLRSDLTPTLDGGFCSLLPGVVRLAFVANRGISGTLQLYDIKFAQAPNAMGGKTTPLKVVVLNFVDIYDFPIPTTVRDGIIIISAIRITKTANPTHVPETGGNVAFTFLVENIGQAAVTLNSLVDDKFGVLAGDGDCQVGTVLAGGASCSFEATFAIPAGDFPGSHVDVFTATVRDVNGSIDTATDDETVAYTDVKPSISATKTAGSASVPETGGNVSFTYEVKNDSAEAAEITALSDDKFGTLTGDADCQVDTVLAAAASCAFTASFAVPPGDAPGAHVNVFTATVSDGDGNNATAIADASVAYTNAKPTITVAKTAAPTSLPEPGGNVEFTVAVTNDSFEPVTLTSLTDNVYGNLNGKDACATGGSILPDASYACKFTGAVSGQPGDYTDTVTAVATDNDGSTETKTAIATVTLTDVKPDITVLKTGVPTSVPKTGGNVTFTYRVTNRSAETATITVLRDDKFGTLGGNAACKVGTALAPGATCEFTATFAIPAGNYPGSHTNIFSATVADDDGNTATATEPETITYTEPNQPGGKILPNGTTCQQYRDGTAGQMYPVQYTLKKIKISTVSPGVFFYYSTVRLTSGQFSITVPQHNAYTDGSQADLWPDIPAQTTNAIILWDAACNRVKATTTSYDPVSNTATISGSAAADIYYVSVKYSPSATYVSSTNSGLVGYTVPAKVNVQYSFNTVLKMGGGAPTPVSGSEATQLVIPKNQAVEVGAMPRGISTRTLQQPRPAQ